MPIPSNTNPIQQLNEAAIKEFMQDPKKSILTVGKDSSGRQYLEVKSKGLWTWVATKLLGLKSYQLDTVTNYIKLNNRELGIYSINDPYENESKSFYKVFNNKIARYNKHHPNTYISTLKQIKTQKVFQDRDLSLLFETKKISTPSVKENVIQDQQIPLAFDKQKEISSPLSKEKNISTPLSQENIIKDKIISKSFVKETEVSQPIAPSKEIPKSETLAKPNQDIAPPDPEAIKETKAELVNFYLNQQARLADLKEQLKTGKEENKHKIQQAITKIECSDMARAKIALKIKSGKEPTVQELAAHLGKSPASTQGFLLGQAYAQTIFKHTTTIIATLASLDASTFGDYEDVITQLKQLKKTDIDGLAKSLQTTKEEAVTILIQLWSAAQEMPGIDNQVIQNLAKTIENEVAQSLNATEQEVDKWLTDLHVEKELALELNRLGEERKTQYPENFKEATAGTFKKNGVSAFTSGMWTFFNKGPTPPPVRNVKDAELQWKLFLNPKHENFQSTLDRALRVLDQMPYINGKIVASDTIKRKSDLAVIDDPCEPKLLFYFNGPNGAEDFKKAIEILEKEFMDAELIGAPAGERDKGNGLEEQWGPSFTKERNRLMFYTQGGFSESGRDYAIKQGQLAERFEGDNYYLHKGFQDPLADMPPSPYSMDTFIAQMDANIHLFNQPLHLVKLQNMLNRLKQDAHPSPQVQQWKEDIQTLMKSVAANMQIQRQSSMMKLLDHWEDLGDVNNAVAKTFHRELNKNLQELDPSKGKIEAKLDHLNRRSQETIGLLESLLMKDMSMVTWEEAVDAIPPSFKEIFYNVAINDTKKLKEKLINDIGNALKINAEKSGILLGSDDLATIITHLQDESYFVAQHNGKLILKKRVNIFWGKPIEVPADLRFILSSVFSSSFPSQIKPLYEALENVEEGQHLIAVNPSGKEVNLKTGMELALKKLQNVKERQENRLKAYQAGEAVVIPYYYHATSEGPASSIAQTGIEAVQASSGFGAFLSSEPEFRYGYVAFGLPKTVEFESKAATIFDQKKAPHIITSDKQVWAGLDHLIGINPRQAALEQNFSSAIRQTVLAMTREMNNISNAQRMEIEERLIQAFNRTVVFRPEMGGDGKQVGWSLNFRNLDWSEKPAGDVIKVTNDESLNKWIIAILTRTEQEVKIPDAEKNEISMRFSADFATMFKKTYYHGKKEEENYVMPGQATQKLKACLIAADDDLKDIYEKEYKSKVKGDAKEIRTLGQMEQQFTNAGLGSDLVEFIPLSEQLIERDFLMEVDATVPRKWE